MEFDYDPICGPYIKGRHSAEAHKHRARELQALGLGNIYGVTKEDLESSTTTENFRAELEGEVDH